MLAGENQHMAIESAADPALEQIAAIVHGRLRSVVAIQIAMVATLIVVLYGNVLVDMAYDWWYEPAWSQGMLLPPLALYIAWIQRNRILRCAPAQDWRGVWMTVFACLLYVFGRLASEFFLTRISFVFLTAGLVWTFWGRRRLRVLALPLLLLASMVPLPVMLYNALAGPLQLLASDCATQIAQMLGISVFRDGNIIQLANVTLGVAEACSGLSALSALVVGSLLLGYLLCTSWVARIALVAASVPLAVFVNVIRVAGTAILADINREFALGFYHAFAGWLVFVAGFGLLYLTARGLHTLFDARFS